MVNTTQFTLIYIREVKDRVHLLKYAFIATFIYNITPIAFHLTESLTWLLILLYMFIYTYLVFKYAVRLKFKAFNYKLFRSDVLN